MAIPSHDSSATAEDRLRQAEGALERREPQAALDLLPAGGPAGPPAGRVLHARALAFRMLGRPVEALAELDEALALDPYDFLARLSKGALLERLGRPAEAAEAYKAAIASAPDPLPAALAAPLARARQATVEHAAGLAAFLRRQTGQERANLSGEEARRLEEAIDIYAGTARAYVQQPLLLHYPRLPAIPFHDRAAFPWLETLEAATDVIAGELAEVMTTAAGDFAPYIAYPPGAPVGPWGELNHSRQWSAFFLWKDGVRQDEAHRRCPRTAALLESLPMARQAGYAPTAMFSALQPRTRIPPHTGSSNTRLLCHLPLVVPGPARFRVGGEARSWRRGEAWVFDDTIEHEAWNDADAVRVILIFDVWNPLLSEGERAAVEAMMAARKAFNAKEAG